MQSSPVARIASCGRELWSRDSGPPVPLDSHSIPTQLTAIVVATLVRPPKVMVIGTAEPVGALLGINTLSCHSPTKPGARPLKLMVAGTPPIVTVGLAAVT